MMAAYIIAVCGRALQAVLLGISKEISHSVIVWVLAILGLLMIYSGWSHSASIGL
ncbi:MAG: hypothetical protein GDA49_12065 [Rhodospirillales bacterium]|nr:hypothetical protein [Rhodospirillales bacterium]